jgi:hypothetical protein
VSGTAPIPTPTKARSLLATAHRRHEPPEVIAKHQRDLAEANINAAIERALATAPPLTDAQCERLAARLRSAS